MRKLLENDWSDTSVAWCEDELQAAVVQFLKREGVDVAGDQNGGKRSKRDGARRKATGMKAGEPDLRLYLPGGRLILVEMKTAKGTASKSQNERHADLDKLGFVVHVIKAKTPDDAVASMASILDACRIAA